MLIMKNIKILLITICSILLFQHVTAQTYYYSPSSVFKNVNGSSVTYICSEKIKGGVYLYNQSNTLTFVRQNKTDGSKMSVEGDRYYTVPSNMTSVIRNTINSYLTAADKKRVIGYTLDVSLYIDSNTGTVKEVRFHFLTNEGFATIPPERYYLIEMMLKRDFKVNMLPEGKKLNYNILTYPYSYW